MRALALLVSMLFVPSVVLAESLSPEHAYVWLTELDPRPETRPLDHVISTPDGWARVGTEAGTLGHWLRALPIRSDRTSVLAYDGRAVRAPSVAVVAMDVGRRDLQQCADTAIRLLSEYAWSSGRADELSWTFTSGDRTAWSDWKAGERLVIAGSRVDRAQGAARPATHRSFRSWLDLVFTYAGTRSVARDGEAVAGPIEAGDVFVSPGSPGHAVIVLDVATHPDGRRAALLGQGFMPAQELHVLDGAGVTTEVLEGAWFVLPSAPGDMIDTPSWAPFARGDARRLR